MRPVEAWTERGAQLFDCVNTSASEQLPTPVTRNYDPAVRSTSQSRSTQARL
jgi:hypothetical protein